MFFEQMQREGCQSYLIGCADTCGAIMVDPESSQTERYLALAARSGLRIHYVLDTHTHADHFSGSQNLARKLGVPVIMHRKSAAPFVDLRVDDGESIIVGQLRLRVMYTPGHTEDSMCLVLPDRVLTGDTLLIGATGRTDLPTGRTGEDQSARRWRHWAFLEPPRGEGCPNQGRRPGNSGPVSRPIRTKKSLRRERQV